MIFCAISILHLLYTLAFPHVWELHVAVTEFPTLWRNAPCAKVRMRARLPTLMSVSRKGNVARGVEAILSMFSSST